MNVLEEYKNVVNNDVEVYLLNFKQRLLEHMRHNDIKACNETLVEINNLQNGIKRGHIVGSNYFLDVLLQMRQLTRNVAKCVKNKNNTLLNESTILQLHNSSTQSIIDVHLLKRIIKYKLMSTDAINELQCKLHNAINANGNNVDLVECNQLFGTYSNNRYKQLYEIIIKNNYIYDSEQNNNTMSKTKQQNTGDTISINEIKSMIDTIINETLANEINYLIPDPSDPEDSVDDFAGDNLDDLQDTVNTLIANVKNETGDWDKSYDRLVDIYKKLTTAIDNPRLSSSQRKRLEHDYEGILGLIHNVIGGGGGGTEKFYVAEEGGNDLMEGSKCNCGEKCNCKQLSECGSWNEAIKHPQFKQAIMKEVAPPGMEKWIKSNKERFKKQYGNIKKAMSILYATAWRMFYKNKTK